MLHFTRDDQQMMNHVGDVVTDRMRHKDGYTEQDEATVEKLDQLTNGLDGTSAVVLTGDEQSESEARDLLAQVVRAELKHWVPGASQRLIYRAANAMGFKQPYPVRDDCGEAAASHSLHADWVAGLYLMRCASCLRLYPTSAEQTA